MMKVKDNVIIECTDVELYSHWLRYWSDFMDYTTYKRQVQEAGTEVIEGDQE